MITRKQMIPLLLEACPSFENIWGPIQRPDEDEFIHVAFGAFASHYCGLLDKGQTSEFDAFDEVIKRFQRDGDPEVRQLSADLVEFIADLLEQKD